MCCCLQTENSIKITRENASPNLATEVLLPNGFASHHFPVCLGLRYWRLPLVHWTLSREEQINTDGGTSIVHNSLLLYTFNRPLQILFYICKSEVLRVQELGFSFANLFYICYAPLNFSSLILIILLNSREPLSESSSS